MPIHERGVSRSDVGAEAKLRNELVAELKKPQKTGEPAIIIEHPSPGTTHLFVIWSSWEEMEQAVRSRIVLDAFAEARGQQEAAEVTVSMGLTQVEAERLGIKL